MPTLFTCRLITVPTADGKVRLRYGYLNTRVGTIITGPEVVIPPDRDMTEAELHEWLSRYYMHGSGYSVAHGLVEPQQPLVEAFRTVAGEIPATAVSHRFFWATLPDGQATLAIELTNNWDDPIPRFALSTVSNNEAAQAAPGMPPGSGHIGSAESFSPVYPLPNNELPVGVAVQFAYHPIFFKHLRSRAVALSPESHWISHESGGVEFARIPGSELSAFLDTLDD